MTQPRPETRVTANLKLRVWGMGAGDRAFSQNAHTCNISSAGALLSGIEPDLKVGETIGLQYGEKKVRCRVVWAINRGAPQKAGVKLLNEQECPWTAELRSIDNDTLVSPQNRRRWNRHKISFLIEIHEDTISIPMRVSATDISANGCYVETIVPFSVGTGLKVDFWIVSEKITTRSIVRTSDPGVGMGIEFVGLNPEQRQRFQEYLEALDPWASSI